MLKLENYLKGVSLNLRPKHASECQTLIKMHSDVKLVVIPGHLFICYGQQNLLNVQSFDTTSSGDSWFFHENKVKKSYLKLKNLPAPILDLIFPTCCMNPILWVVLENGIVFIWTFNRSKMHGPKWTPTGQFYITDTLKNSNDKLENVLYHKPCNSLFWVEKSYQSLECCVKKMPLPTDVSSINDNSDLPTISAIFTASPACTLFSFGDSVLMKFIAPCPPGITGVWKYPNKTSLYLNELANGEFNCIWSKMDSAFEENDFKTISLKLSRFWNKMVSDDIKIYTIIALKHHTALIILESGSVILCGTKETYKTVLKISNFSLDKVKGCFAYMKMLCCIFVDKILVYSLENFEMIEIVDGITAVKHTFEHSCCIKRIGLVLGDGSVLRLNTNNPTTIFKSKNKFSPSLLDASNQYYLEFINRLHSLAIQENSDLENVEKIMDKLVINDSPNHESMLCLVKQVMRNRNLIKFFKTRKFEETKKNYHQRTQLSQIDYFHEIENLMKEIIESSVCDENP